LHGAAREPGVARPEQDLQFRQLLFVVNVTVAAAQEQFLLVERSFPPLLREYAADWTAVMRVITLFDGIPITLFDGNRM